MAELAHAGAAEAEGEGEVRAALVSFGASARTFHGPLIGATPRMRVTHVVQRHDRGDGTDAAEVYSAEEVTVLRSVDALCDAVRAGEVHLAVVCTPVPLHFEMARSLLTAGAHVVVEKPFTVTATEADELVALAAEQDKVLSVFHNRRLDADFLTVQKMLQEDGVLGDPVVEFSSAFDRYRPAVKVGWKTSAIAGAGLLYDLGSHLIDQAICLFGMPTSVSADVRTQHPDSENTDFFDISLRYADRPHLKVSLRAGNLCRAASPRFVVHGMRGSFVKRGLDGQEDALKAGRVPRIADTARGGARVHDAAWGGEPESQWGEIDATVPSAGSAPDAPPTSGTHISGTVEPVRGRYYSFYCNLAEAILDGAELLVTASQARDVVRIIELCQESATSGRVVPV